MGKNYEGYEKENNRPTNMHADDDYYTPRCRNDRNRT